MWHGADVEVEVPVLHPDRVGVRWTPEAAETMGVPYTQHLTCWHRAWLTRLPL